MGFLELSGQSFAVGGKTWGGRYAQDRAACAATALLIRRGVPSARLTMVHECLQALDPDFAATSAKRWVSYGEGVERRGEAVSNRKWGWYPPAVRKAALELADLVQRRVA